VERGGEDNSMRVQDKEGRDRYEMHTRGCEESTVLTARAYTTQLLLCMLHTEQKVEGESDGVAYNIADLAPGVWCVWLCGV